LTAVLFQAEAAFEAIQPGRPRPVPFFSKSRPLQGARVLVAEDEPVLAFDIMEVLNRAGAIIVGPALTAYRALQLANEEHVSCGLLDVKFRDGPIFPAAEMLENKGAGLVFYTCRADPIGLKQDWPKAEVISKPIPLRFLIAAIQRASFGRRSGSA
jgi:DNA-binding NarL/FixJ family response regulator